MAEWYVVQIRGGQENNIKKSLALLQEEYPEGIIQFILPVEQVTELNEGKKKIRSQYFMPGYLLLEMEPDEELFHLVRSTPGILRLLGSEKEPAPLSRDEVGNILSLIEERKEKPVPKYDFVPGNQVEIRDGPFKDFSGIVEEVIPEKEKIRVSVSIFGRSTSVEVDVLQVEKI